MLGFVWPCVFLSFGEASGVQLLGRAVTVRARFSTAAAGFLIPTSCARGPGFHILTTACYCLSFC